MATQVRIDAEQAFQKPRAHEAILVCAYNDEAKCKRLRLPGAYTMGEFRARQGELSRNLEIIFYCT